MRYQFNGRLVRKYLFFTDYCKNICFRNISFGVYRYNQLMPRQRMKKYDTPKVSQKANNQP